MNTNITRPTFRWEWNINTLAIIFAFVLSFVAWGYTLSGIIDKLQQAAANIVEMKATDTNQAARISALELIQAKAEQVDYKIGLLEKSDENFDSRISRLSETYSNQFADFRTQLSAISTQIALVAQSQARLENRPIPPSVVVPIPQTETPGSK